LTKKKKIVKWSIFQLVVHTQKDVKIIIYVIFEKKR